jgi:hypothetical protein
MPLKALSRYQLAVARLCIEHAHQAVSLMLHSVLRQCLTARE